MRGFVILSALAGISLTAFAETTAPVKNSEAPASAQTTSVQPASSSTATVPSPSDSKFWAFLELRPTYARSNGKIDTEDTIELGYQFNKTTKLSYAQFLKTELLPSGASLGKGVNLRGDGGFLRMRVNDFFVSNDKTTRLSYQGRIYTPTDDSMSGTGLVGALYNGVSVAKDLGPVTLSLWEVPIFWAFSQGGSGTAANPIFQNRVMLVADFKITKNLLFSVPFVVDTYRNRVFAPSQLSDRWEYNIWTWPELDYTINDVHTIGIAWRSKSFLSANGVGSTFDKALGQGQFQALWNVSL